MGFGTAGTGRMDWKRKIFKDFLPIPERLPRTLSNYKIGTVNEKVRKGFYWETAFDVITCVGVF